MKTQISKWGNSLAVRIPKAAAQSAKLRDGDELELIVARPGNIELRSRKRKPKLQDLVKGITRENRHKEADWGAPVGKEVW